MMEFNNNSATASRTDRKFIERNRRTQMKALYSELHSLVPRQISKEVISAPDQLDEATRYIKKLQVKLERMKEKKDMLMGIDRNYNHDDDNDGKLDNRIMKMGLRSPQIEIHHMGSALEISVITELDCQFIFNEIVRVLHGEAIDIVNASYTVTKDAVFHTIHCQVGESGDHIGRISERLKFLCGSGAF